MTQPTAYNPASDFSDLESSDPVDGLATIGTKLDAEFSALNTTIDETLANLALLQRDDGALANGVVNNAQLGSGVTIGVTNEGDWATATAYVVDDAVLQNSKLYRCIVAHTSGTFATDLAAAKWVEMFDFTSITATASAQMLLSVTAHDNTDSPVALTEDDNGKGYTADTSSGNIQYTLPDSSGLSDGDFVRYVIFRTSASNALTLARSGSDTINGATSYTVPAVADIGVLVYATGTTDWIAIPLGYVVDATIDAAMIQADAVITAKILDGNVTTAKLAADAVTPAKADLNQAADVSSGSGTTTIDAGANARIKVTATGNITIDVTPGSSKAGSLILEAVNFGAHTITWTGIDTWPGGSAPTLTTSGTDLIGIDIDDDGNVNGFLMAENIS